MEHSRINRRLMRAARRLPASPDSPLIVVRDLYSLYPDYLIDVEAEQALLASAKLIVWQHPIHWYSMPPLMKLWLDDVLSFGWAYGPGGTALARQGPVAGRDHRRPGRIVPARQLQPLFLRGFHAALRADRQPLRLALPAADAAARRPPGDRGGCRGPPLETYAQRLASYPNWPELGELLYELPALVPEDARPDDESDDAADPPRSR